MNTPSDDEFLGTMVSGAGTGTGTGTGTGDASVPDVMGHYLVAIKGSEPGKRVEVADSPVTIGRTGAHTLVFPGDSELSRLHARVSFVNGTVIAEDMGSTNGTFVDKERITKPTILREGSVLRVGRQLLKYERRSRREVERTEELDRDLRKASAYVLSLLPPPLQTGPVHVEWRFLPSAQLGGDAFGYDWLDPNTFVFYLVDVSGHGVGSAMHSVSVMNVLRQRALPNVDFANPAAVLVSLNDRFQMSLHNGLFFTMWYGVYRVDDRTLTYASAGHHPAFLLPPGVGQADPLGAPALMIGAIPEGDYEVRQTTVSAGSRLHLFSDGVFEFVTRDQQRWTLEDFLPLLLDPPVPGVAEPERLYRAVIDVAGAELPDDFSLLTVTFQ
jgi:serine phosphatase RsbU (regulator of sigma subunit)